MADTRKTITWTSIVVAAVVVGVLGLNYRTLQEAYYLDALRSNPGLITEFVMQKEKSAKYAALEAYANTEIGKAKLARTLLEDLYLDLGTDPPWAGGNFDEIYLSPSARSISSAGMVLTARATWNALRLAYLLLKMRCQGWIVEGTDWRLSIVSREQAKYSIFLRVTAPSQRS